MGAVIKYSMTDVNAANPTPLYEDENRTIGEALVDVVRLLGNVDPNWGSWIEEIRDPLESGEFRIKIGSHGMPGESWIHSFEGPGHEIYPLMQVCWWFYQVTARGSDAVRAITQRVVQETPGHPAGSESNLRRPHHRGYPGVAIAA